MSESEAMCREANRRRGEVIRIVRQLHEEGVPLYDIVMTAGSGFAKLENHELDCALSALEEIERRQIEEATR